MACRVIDTCVLEWEVPSVHVGRSVADQGQIVNLICLKSLSSTRKNPAEKLHGCTFPDCMVWIVTCFCECSQGSQAQLTPSVLTLLLPRRGNVITLKKTFQQHCVNILCRLGLRTLRIFTETCDKKVQIIPLPEYLKQSKYTLDPAGETNSLGVSVGRFRIP